MSFGVHMYKITTGTIIKQNVSGRKYIITGFLGKGGSAEVYRAHCEETRQEVALKIAMKMEEGYDGMPLETINGFMASEGKALRMLTRSANGGAVEYIDQGKAILNGEEHRFIAMEILEKETLRDSLNITGKIPPKAALNIIIQLCDCLIKAHKQGLLHNDIKPANVLLKKTENQHKAILTDWGLALSQELIEKGLLRRNSIKGTLKYMAPEQFQGEENDQRSDIYSLGCLLAEMLTGEAPFSDKNQVQLIAAKMERPVEIVISDDSLISKILKNLIKKMTAPIRENRYRDCAVVKSLIERIVQEISLEKETLRISEAHLMHKGDVIRKIAAEDTL